MRYPRSSKILSRAGYAKTNPQRSSLFFLSRTWNSSNNHLSSLSRARARPTPSPKSVPRNRGRISNRFPRRALWMSYLISYWHYLQFKFMFKLIQCEDLEGGRLRLFLHLCKCSTISIKRRSNYQLLFLHRELHGRFERPSNSSQSLYLSAPAPAWTFLS